MITSAKLLNLYEEQSSVSLVIHTCNPRPKLVRNCRVAELEEQVAIVDAILLGRGEATG